MSRIMKKGLNVVLNPLRSIKRIIKKHKIITFFTLSAFPLSLFYLDSSASLFSILSSSVLYGIPNLFIFLFMSIFVKQQLQKTYRFIRIKHKNNKNISTKNADILDGFTLNTDKYKNSIEILKQSKEKVKNL